MTMVLYICVGFWLLAHSTRDLSQAEKKIEETINWFQDIKSNTVGRWVDGSLVCLKFILAESKYRISSYSFRSKNSVYYVKK
jgi:hypothetical protein